MPVCESPLPYLGHCSYSHHPSWLQKVYSKRNTQRAQFEQNSAVSLLHGFSSLDIQQTRIPTLHEQENYLRFRHNFSRDVASTSCPITYRSLQSRPCINPLDPDSHNSSTASCKHPNAFDMPSEPRESCRLDLTPKLAHQATQEIKANSPA